MTIGFTNSVSYVHGYRDELEFTRSKLDAAIFIDARSIPDKMFVNVLVGLIEPRNTAALKFLTRLSNLKQLLIETQVSPWVAVGVVWPVEIDAT